MLKGYKRNPDLNSFSCVPGSIANTLLPEYTREPGIIRPLILVEQETLPFRAHPSHVVLVCFLLLVFFVVGVLKSNTPDNSSGRCGPVASPRKNQREVLGGAKPKLAWNAGIPASAARTCRCLVSTLLHPLEGFSIDGLEASTLAGDNEAGGNPIRPSRSTKKGDKSLLQGNQRKALTRFQPLFSICLSPPKR